MHANCEQWILTENPRQRCRAQAITVWRDRLLRLPEADPHSTG